MTSCALSAVLSIQKGC